MKSQFLFLYTYLQKRFLQVAGQKNWIKSRTNKNAPEVILQRRAWIQGCVFDSLAEASYTILSLVVSADFFTISL